MAANITTGGNQSYDPGEGIRIFQGLKPDIVMIQEFRYKDSSKQDIDDLVSQAFGPQFKYYREPGNGSKGYINNGVISRWPIIKSGVWDDPYTSNREFTFAQIDIPGRKDLWAVSVHMLNRGASRRASEATELLQYIKNTIPNNDYLAVGGDFNTITGNETAITKLKPTLDLTAVPTDQQGESNTNNNRKKHYDWVLPNYDLSQFHIPVKIGSNTFPSGLVFDSRVFTPISDVPPIRASDCSPSTMQHMAVVKDFNVPADE